MAVFVRPFTRPTDSLIMNASTRGMIIVSTIAPTSPPEPPKPRSSDERLVTAHAFRRFVARVRLRAGRWIAHRGVPEGERDDVLQAALLRMYRQREHYDPALGCWESWAYTFVDRVAKTHSKGRLNRIKVVDVAIKDDLPDLVSDAPSPEEEHAATMMQALLDKCMANLDDDSRAALHASAEGIEMRDIAAALGLSLPGAYARVKTARARLQAALDREQNRKRALGVLVLPLTIDQLLASDTTTAHFSAETMQRIWKTLDRVMAADVAAGKLWDDGTEVLRYMGSPNVTAPRTGLGARILRTLGPRTLSVLTHVGTAAASAGVVYLLMRHDPPDNEPTADARAATSRVARVEYPRDPAPSDTAAPSTAPSAGAAPLPELRADAGTAPRTDAGSGPRAAGRDDSTGEVSLFDLGSIAFQSNHYEDAITALREHAIKYPRCAYSDARERLFTLSLIRIGRKAEARQRIERLRRASPESALLAEFDAAMNASDR
jgi:RNA polymerase sigma factor (sigma-70 family)